MRAAVLSALLIALPFVASCGDPLKPDDLRGDYTLVSQDGRALPQLLSATLSCDVSLTGGLLTFSASGSDFTLDLTGSMDCSRGGGPVQVVGWTYPGSYAIDGRRIEFTSPIFGGGAVTFSGTVLLNKTINVVLDDFSSSASGDLKPTFQRQ
jgi:hypothetical protein